MRRGGDALTGGTGDVSPQWLTFNSLLLSAANTYTETTINLPITRLPVPKGKAMVLELLKARFQFPQVDLNPTAGGSLISIFGQINPTSQAAIGLGNPQTFAQSSLILRGAFTAAGSYESVYRGDVECDCTDGAGHGVLVATDNLFFGANTAGFNAAATFNCKLLYRFKIVKLEEYIGIVQSQQ